MKLKITITVLLIFLTNTYAQNTTMAKAFYKKAQKAYAEKEYSDVTTYIGKTKEYLGTTNPDIIYLEAKARLKIDMNINETKELLSKFITDAPEDSRIEEIADLLADIETSGNYYDNGNRKTYIYFIDNNKYIREYNINGDEIILKSFYGNSKKSRTTTYFINEKEDNEIVFDKNEYPKYQIFYKNNVKRAVTFSPNQILNLIISVPATYNDKGIVNPVLYMVANDINYVWITINKVYKKQHWTLGKYGELKAFYSFYRFNNWNDYDAQLLITDGQIVDYYDTGVAKTVKKWKYKRKGYYIYHFNKDADLIETKDYNKKGKLIN